jgi:hypothetical protein
MALLVKIATAFGAHLAIGQDQPDFVVRLHNLEVGQIALCVDFRLKEEIFNVNFRVEKETHSPSGEQCWSESCTTASVSSKCSSCSNASTAGVPSTNLEKQKI